MKTMTIFIDGSENDKDSLTSAVSFCRFLEGHLTVVSTHQESIVATPDGFVTVLVDESDETSREAAQAAYNAICGGLRFTEWQATDETKTQAIVRQGLLSDVTILERVSSQTGATAAALNTALFNTPGPVMVTPPNALPAIGESVAVVWTPSFQSARALRSALPILSRAKAVTTIINESDNRIDAEALVRYLQLHGIETALCPFDGAGLTARGRGRAVLAAAASVEADFLVMGAFGEDRLASLVGLGRATQKIISATNIPTLVQS